MNYSGFDWITMGFDWITEGFGLITEGFDWELKGFDWELKVLFGNRAKFDDFWRFLAWLQRDLWANLEFLKILLLIQYKKGISSAFLYKKAFLTLYAMILGRFFGEKKALV